MEESWENRLDDDRLGIDTPATPWLYWLPALFGVVLIAGVLIVVIALGPSELNAR